MKPDVRRYDDFLEMFRECECIVVNVCLCFTDRSHDDIRDLYQEIACTLWEAWPSYRGRSDSVTWATRVALNVAGQEIRRRKRRPHFVSMDERVLRRIADEASDEHLQRLYSLIDCLGDDDRKLLFLYLDRRPLREIAAIAGIGEDAVKQRIYRLKQKLNHLNTEKDDE